MGVVGLTLFRFIDIHLLNLLDCSPHEVPFKKVLSLGLGYSARTTASKGISSSRIALVADFRGSNVVKERQELTVWDWRTGEVVCGSFIWAGGFRLNLLQVFRRSTGDPDVGHAISGIYMMAFLDGTWMLVLSYCPEHQLLILDTLLPDHDLRSLRTLQLPPGSASGTGYGFSTQYGNSLAEYPEFLVDPSQRNFVIFSSTKLALVVPVNLLDRCMGFEQTDGHISWDNWGKDVTTIHLPDTVKLQIGDKKVLALRLRSSEPSPDRWGVEMYDLSKSAKDTQVQQVGEYWDERCRKVLPTPRWFRRCHAEGDEPHLATYFLGNKVVSFYVGLPCVESRRCCSNC